MSMKKLGTCLNKGSRNHMKYTVDRVTCDNWEDGDRGRVDEPGGNPYEEAPL